jgi:hypothetical protein
MTDMQASTWAICERVAEAQALLHDHTEGGRFTADELVRKLAALSRASGNMAVVTLSNEPRRDL